MRSGLVGIGGDLAVAEPLFQELVAAVGAVGDVARFLTRRTPLPYDPCIVIRRLTLLGQLSLLAALLMIPGLGTVDYCLAQNRVCHEAKTDACCCRPGEPDEEKAPCCITVHQDWMVPLRDAVPGSSPEAGDLLPPDFPETVLPGVVGPTVLSQAVPPDPPPPSRGVFLALIQVRLL